MRELLFTGQKAAVRDGELCFMPRVFFAFSACPGLLCSEAVFKKILPWLPFLQPGQAKH